MQDEAREDRTLRRIIALLVALAGLAERTASRSYPVRFLVLLVLRRAEAIARDCVADVMLVDGLWFDDGMERTSSPDDALLLAQRFRLLSEELVALLQPAGRFGLPARGRDADPCGAAVRVVIASVAVPAAPGLALGPFDTS